MLDTFVKVVLKQTPSVKTYSLITFDTNYVLTESTISTIFFQCKFLMGTVSFIN